MKKILLLIVMCLIMVTNTIDARKPYVSVHMYLGKQTALESVYKIALNYDKSKKSWITVEGFSTKKIVMILDDDTEIELKRTGTTYDTTYWIPYYGDTVYGNVKSCNITCDFSLSKKNMKLLCEHDIKKVYTYNFKRCNEYDTDFCLAGYYYVLDEKHEAKKNGNKDEYLFIR